MNELNNVKNFYFSIKSFIFASIKRIVGMELTYKTKRCSKLTDEEFEQCSALFSGHYGKYSGKGDKPKGQRIKMSVGLYKRFYANNDDMYVSLCYEGRELLGQAFFLKTYVDGKGVCSWVTQLVVNSRYRRLGIGSRLLLSAWGFSDYFAWGLATANAITLKTLESATWRKIDVSDISQNIDTLKTLMLSIPFANKEKIILSPKQSMVFTNFYPEFESLNKDKSLSIYAKRLGQIKSGYEWLAFTFASQEMYYDSGKLEKFLEFSELQLKEAYERMNMTDQPWTHGTDKELDFVESFIEWGKDSEILDLGCGQGRHSIELYKRGYENISGVDFSEQNIKKASALAREHSTFPMFMCADARKLKLGRKFDVVLCLFDVIGSFRSEDDNMRILKTIRHHLKKGGKAIVSVMNMELTEHIAIHRVSLKEFPQEILKLPPSDTMSRSGDIFKPEHFLINTDDGLVYRKEQFTDDDMISAEYLVADKRYYMSEFESFVKKAGFVVKEKRFVQAGHFERPLSSTDSRAKEILFVLATE